VCACVCVGVRVGVRVRVDVSVGVGVSVGMGMGVVGVGVGVGVGELHTDREASWRRVFDPYTPLLFNWYHSLEQNLHFGLVPEN